MYNKLNETFTDFFTTFVNKIITNQLHLSKIKNIYGLIISYFNIYLSNEKIIVNNYS